MVKRLSVAVFFLLAALPACGALIGVKSLIDPEDDGPDASSDGAPATDGMARTDAPGGDGGGGADGGCGDTTQSKDNCGRCGHSCQGGACKAGACQPVALATGQGEVYGVALDATYVYFASFTSNLVARVPKAGGKVETLTSAAGPLARKVAVDATHVYWTADDSPGVVSRCLLAGCSGAPEVFATPDRPMGLALDSTAVYWADRNSSDLRKRPIDGGPEAHVATSNGLPIAVAVDSAQVFWIDDFSGQVQGRAGDGGTFVVGTSGASGRDLALDGAFVYWAAAIDLGQDGRISRAPRTGAGPVETLGPANGEPVDLVVDGPRVYWTAWDRSADGGVVTAGVYACAVAGCGAAPTTLAAGQDLPRGIAFDDAAIYWGASGGVMKLAKP